MKEFCHTLKGKYGLHARPAGMLSTAARGFESDITVYNGEKAANCKRILSVMSLGAVCGTEIRFVIEGNDEEAAEKALKEFCQNQLDKE